MRRIDISVVTLLAAAAFTCLVHSAAGAGSDYSLDAGRSWVRHTIDASSRGADGVRLADANGDGRLDIVTGWEEGGVVRLYLHPGTEKVRAFWPAVTVARVDSVEDAVLADLDHDGGPDVVISCEGNVQSLFIAWSPADQRRLYDPAAWQVEAIPPARGATRWMFALPLQIDGLRGVDLVVASKAPNGCIGWFACPEQPRDLARWLWHPLRRAGWVMSLIASDMDGDGDLDIVCSDRKGPGRGCFWLENPGRGLVNRPRPWREHTMGGQGREVMFMSLADFDGDGDEDALAAVKKSEILVMRRRSGDGTEWQTESIPFPENAGTAKAVVAADLDGAGTRDLVVSCEGADDGKVGVFALRYRDGTWAAQSISGPDGVKFDLVALQDLDADGDLDILSCEERANLGVFWYENPAQR